MDVLVAFGLCVGVENHGHLEPVPLGKRHIHNFSHIPLTLILLPDADKADVNIRFFALANRLFSPEPPYATVGENQSDETSDCLSYA